MHMHEIQIRLPSDDRDQTVQEMRRWMKTHGCEPVDFSCHDLGHHTTVVVVEFKNESERCAFSEQFGDADGVSAGLRPARLIQIKRSAKRQRYQSAT